MSRTSSTYVRNDQYERNRLRMVELDRYVQMQENGHLYDIEGVSPPVLTSASGILKLYFPFDEDGAVRAVLKSRNYNDPSYQYYQMTSTQIKALWNSNSEKGTNLHSMVEHFYVQLPVDAVGGASHRLEFQYFLNYQREVVTARGWHLYRTEWMVFSIRHWLCGSIDGVYYYPRVDGSFDPRRVILNDWKRSAGLKERDQWSKPALGIASGLYNTNKFKYECQLNIYKWFLETFYGIVVVEMYITVFHPTSDNYILYSVPDRQPLIRQMMAERMVVVEKARPQTLEYLKQLNRVDETGEALFSFKQPLTENHLK